MTANSRAHDAFIESEAVLRLVDHEIGELREVAQPDDRFGGVSLTDLPEILARANEQIQDVLSRLRETRAALQSPAFEKLQSTNEKILEVTSATEDAAINIMDACDRANGLVDELDAIDQAEVPDRDNAVVLRASLRDELFRMMGALQFQDITSQQLSHASSVLVEMELRLAEVAKLFDTNISVAPVAPSSVELAYDPNATVRNAEGRQALADEIFTAIKLPAA